MKRLPLLLMATLVACAVTPSPLRDPRGDQPLRDSRVDLPLRDSRGDLPLSTSLVGRVVDADGSAVPGVSVRVFSTDDVAEGSKLVSHNSGTLTDALPLVSNNTGALTGTPVKPFRSPRNIQGAAATVETGPDGTFAMSLPVGRYNVECADAKGALKAWRAGVPIQDTGRTDLSNVTLRPTGILEGRVRFDNTLATNFIGAEVFVPGSSYLAKVRQDGGYVLTGIPEGVFDLVGWHPEQGVGRLPKSVEVRSGQKTSVSEIVLSLEVPEILGIQTEDGFPTDNGAPGTTIKLVGLKFGVSKGRPLSVTLKGQPVDGVRADTDRSLSFSVPSRAETGNLVVTVGGRLSAGFHFRVLKSIRPKMARYQVARDARFTLSDLYTTIDSDDEEVREIRLSGGQIRRHAPNAKLTYERTEKLTMDGQAVLAVNVGVVRVRAVAGDLMPENIEVEVVNELPTSPSPTVSPSLPPTAPPVPSASPTTAPSTPPTPAPTAIPTIAPTPAPTPIPSSTPVPTPGVVPGGSGKLAPDDTGNPLEHHDYIKVKNGVASTFVWVPVFEAIQLLKPQNCGLTYSAHPVGYWLESPPNRGVENVDWVRERFGGFYAGKYEASRADAKPGSPVDGSGATAGTSLNLKVAQNCVPWTDLYHDHAVEACQAYDPACHLIEDDEWTALAVWSMTRGVTVHGFNGPDYTDADDPAIRFRMDPTVSGRNALTGTGLKVGWSGTTNLTTHTGTSAGVYDLNGNVWEWTATLGTDAFKYLVKGNATGIRMPSRARVMSLSTDPLLRRYGVASSTGAGTDYLGQDFFTDGGSETVAMRGGMWGMNAEAGIWCLHLGDVRTNAGFWVGFRPVLRY